MKKLLSRKLMLTVAIFITATVLLATGVITPDDWIGLCKWLIVTYSGANVVEHGTETVKSIRRKNVNSVK